MGCQAPQTTSDLYFIKRLWQWLRHFVIHSCTAGGTDAGAELENDKSTSTSTNSLPTWIATFFHWLSCWAPFVLIPNCQLLEVVLCHCWGRCWLERGTLVWALEDCYSSIVPRFLSTAVYCHHLLYPQYPVTKDSYISQVIFTVPISHL